MGNQQRKQKKGGVRKAAAQQQQHETIDLDDVVERWVWDMWERSKTKSLSRYKREELLIKVNWKQVVFTQTTAQFSGSPPVRLPKSRILFRTHFNNRTASEQSYSFKADRATRSTFQFTFTHRLRKSHESAVIVRLPDEIARLAGGIEREQYLQFGQDTIKEYELRWQADSLIAVPPRTSTYAELNVDEEEFNGDFSFWIQFFGRITATISTRQSPKDYLKFLDGDIVEIVREHNERANRASALEVTAEHPSTVRYKMRGKCSFRYGLEQHIAMTQQALDAAPVAAVGNEIYLHIGDDV